MIHTSCSYIFHNNSVWKTQFWQQPFQQVGWGVLMIGCTRMLIWKARIRWYHGWWQKQFSIKIVTMESKPEEWTSILCVTKDWDSWKSSIKLEILRMNFKIKHTLEINKKKALGINFGPFPPPRKIKCISEAITAASS